MAIDFKKQAERLVLASDGLEAFLRQFAAEVLRDAATEPFIENCGANSFLENRAKEYGCAE